MKKRIISLALCFLLVFSHVLPVAAVDSSEPACSGSCEDTTSAATHTADCAVYAYYESMSAKGAQHMYENWDAISESDRANLLIWLDAHNPDMAAELRALLTPAAEESTPTETTVPAEPQPAVEEKTLESGEFSVTGKDIPEGAELIIGEFPMPYSADTPAVSMYNIKVYDGDEVWQPANGETVEVSIPVSNPDAETVNVVHFMEDPDKIRYALDNGLAATYDFSGASEDFQAVFEASIYGYQKATNSDGVYVVFETFLGVPVVDGKVTVDANGFSIFSSENAESDPVKYSINNTDFVSVEKQYDTIYVRQNEWIRFVADPLLVGEFSVSPSNYQYVEIISGDDLQWISDAEYYFHVSESAPVGDTFTITWTSLDNFWNPPRITVKIIKDFDYGNVRIGVVSHTGEYPNEIKTHDDTDVDYFYANEKLNADNTIYGTAPREVVDIDALMHSSSFVANDTQTVYGLSDITGIATTVFLKDTFAAIADNILTEYCEDNRLDEDSYELIVYVIKYEAVGNNVGWYINCKVELKSNFVLSYDYNPPAGFTEFHIGTQKKPDAQSIPTNGQESVTATVGVGTGMILSTTIDGKTEEATFVGWSRDPNATATDTLIEDGADITITEDTVLYAIWEVSYHYEDASISFKKTVQDPEGNAVTNDTTKFSFTASGGAGFDRLTYTIYNANGTQASTGKFAAAAPTFTLTNGQFIVIEGVVNSSSDYIITEAVPDGYSAQNNGVTTISINADTNKTGVFSRELVNTRLTYSLTYTGIGVTESTEDVAIGSTVTVAAAPNRNGYDFVGWSDGSNTYQAGNTFTMPAQNVTLTAQWTPTNYTITYNGLDGAIVSGNPATYTIESDAITLNNPTKEGYTFDGWSGTDITGLSKSVTIPAGSIGDRTYTANWTRITYPVTYNTNGGTGTFEAQTKEYGIALTLHSDVPVKEGYSFSGWFGSDGNTYEAGASYTLNAALTLTAQWKAIVADLKIKTVLNASEPYADQNFVFIVTGDPDDKNIDTITIEVALDGNNEVVIGNMPAGTYTVTEKGNWTWRYNGIQSREAIVDSDGDTVTFTFGEPDTKLWLSGYHYGKK